MQKPCSWLNVVIFVRCKNDGDVRLDFSREVKQATKTLWDVTKYVRKCFPQRRKQTTGLIQLYFWISCCWDVSSSTLLTNRIRNRCKWFFIDSRFLDRMELSLVCLHENVKQYENSKLYSIYRGDEKVNWVAMSFRPLTKLYYIFSAGRV